MEWDHLTALSVARAQYFVVGSIVDVDGVLEARTPGGRPLARSAHARCNTQRSNRPLRAGTA